ncbi:hypothetical protein [Halobaculum sp. P14]|uniref:hypothetical protein n=1 Tax=Halobaculum sp. P14 TaxID=3421638 RepID=UPI003EBBCC65
MMDAADRRAAAVLVGCHAAVGVGLAVAGFAAADWARAQFVADAAGSAVGALGPTFLAAAALSAAATALVAGVVTAGVTGALVGAQYVRPTRAAAVAGAGGIVGAPLLAALAVAGIQFGVAGAGAAQVFSAAQAAVPVAVAAVGAGVAGAGCGAVAAAAVQ